MTGNQKHPNRNLIGWLLALVLMLILFMTACSPEYYYRRCPTIEKETITIHDTTVIRDTVVKIEERTLEIHDTVPCDDFELNKDSGGVQIKVLVKDKIIYVKASCAALELKLRLYDKVRTITKSKELTRFSREKKKCNFWLPFILGAIAASILWNLKRIIPFVVKMIKPL